MSSSRSSGSRTARGRVILNQAYAAQADLDWLGWVVGLSLSAALRVDFELSKLELWGQLAILPVALLCQVVAGGLTGLYRGRWQRGSFEEVAAVGQTVALAGVVLFIIDAVATDPRMVPLTAVIGGAIIAFVVMCGTRYWARLREDRRRRPHGGEVERVLVVGAGEGGRQVISSMLRNPGGQYLPVAILDDDPEKQNLRLRGIPVIGTTSDVVGAIDEHRVSTVLIAIPSAPREVIARVTRGANARGLVVKLLPTVLELIQGNVSVSDIRPLEPADLLGREPVHTDVDSIAAYLTGKRVLVTGAGGSIGSELCRQISRLHPDELMMLDRDESALHAVQLSLTGRGLLDTREVILADIRDRSAMKQIFEQRRPQVVFHAAALKHLPMLEQYPEEGVKTNVLGTLNVLELAVEHRVERLVNVSTDKAADPTSVLGFTKRLAERLTAQIGLNAGEGEMLSVRFGNVLGSRGSMLETFRAQIWRGGPVTVTDPEVTRFFMTISEACELVVQAGAIGSRGEVLVLDMGRPVRIVDVARQLIAQTGRQIEIVFTGLRPGEKLHEDLVATHEVAVRRGHELISHVQVPGIGPEELQTLATPDGPATLTAQLRLLCSMGAANGPNLDSPRPASR